MSSDVEQRVVDFLAAQVDEPLWCDGVGVRCIAGELGVSAWEVAAALRELAARSMVVQPVRGRWALVPGDPSETDVGLDERVLEALASMAPKASRPAKIAKGLGVELAVVEASLERLRKAGCAYSSRAWWRCGVPTPARSSEKQAAASAPAVDRRANEVEELVLEALRRAEKWLGVRELATRAGVRTRQAKAHAEAMLDEGLVLKIGRKVCLADRQADLKLLELIRDGVTETLALGECADLVGAEAVERLRALSAQHLIHRDSAGLWRLTMENDR